MLSELFSTESRYSGAAVSREFAAILFGGFAPLIAVSLAAASCGASWPVGIYVVVLATIAFVAALLAPETCRAGLSDSRES